MSDATRDASVRLNAEIDPYRREVQAAATETDKLAAAVDKLSAKLDGLTKRAGKKLMLFGGGATAGATALAMQAADFEKKLSTLNATAAITDRRMGDFTKTIKGISREFPISRTEAAALVTTLDKLGVAGQKNLRMVAESSVKLSAATGENLGGLASQVVELQKQMGTLNAGTMDTFANSLVQVSKSAGVSASGVLSFAQAIAPAARAAEMSQASVLGVSAAFTAAGADGFLAANTFSTILNDITRQVVTGSPEIAKYSNLLGVTTEQFARMDKGEAVAGIFEVINKQGPDAIKTLDRLGFDGVRAMRSIQAVSQSGGLRTAIAEAVGAYQTTAGLDAGASAAMDGLYDELARTKNMMQQIATEAGGPLLVFFDKLAEGINAVAGPLVPLASGLGALGTTIAGGGGLATFGLGGAMALAGVKTAVAGAGFVAKSNPVLGALAGWQAGRAAANGQLPAEGTRAYDALERYTGKGMRWFEKMGFLPAMGYAGALGAGDGPGFLQRFGGPAATAPLRVARTVFDAQAEWYRNSRRDGIYRPAPVLGNLGNVANAAMNFPAFLTGLRSGAPAEAKTAAGAARDPEDFGRRLGELKAATVAHTAATTANISVQRQLAVQSGALVASFVRLQAAGMRAAASLAMQGIGVAGRGLAGAAVGLLGGNPWIAGATAIGAAGYFAYANRNQGMPEASTSAPVDKYNAALGIATSQLTNFTEAINAVTAALPNAGGRLESAAQVSSDVVRLANMPKRKLTNDIFANLKTDQSRAALIELMGVSDPRQLALIQADLTQAQGRGTAQDTTDIFFRRRERGLGINYKALVRDIDTEQGQGFKGLLGAADPTAQKMVEAVFGSILGQGGNDAKRFSEAYAKQRQINELGGFFGQALGSNLDIKYGPLGPKTKGGRTATQAVRGFEENFLGGERTGFNAAEFEKKTRGMSDQEASEYFFTEFLANSESNKARQYVRQMRKDGVDFGGVSLDQLDDLKFENPSAYRREILGIGRVGRIALQNSTIQRAVDLPGDVNAQYQGINELLNKTTELTGSFSGTNAELQKLKAAAKDASDPLYRLANAAQQMNTARRQDAMGYMDRNERLMESVQNYRGALTYRGADREEQTTAARNELLAARKGYADYMASVIQAQKNFAIQMRRGEEDMQIAIARSNEDFAISMAQAEEDYYRSRMRSQRDFAIAMANQTEDFNISQERQQEDFARSLRRQAQDTAKGVYEPFARMRLEYTTSSAGLLQNLKDQSEFVENQVANVRKLREMGLSRQAVDMLRLADPDRAQQTNRLAEDLAVSPGQIARINRQVRRRQGAVTDLTQSPLSQQYRRTVADFERGMERATADFERSQARANEANARMLSDMAINFAVMSKRATDAHNRSLDRMGADYERQVRRAQADLARMSQEVYDEFGKMMVKAIDLVTANLGSMGDAVVAQLRKIRKEAPELFEDIFESNPNRGYSPTSARAAEGRGVVSRAEVRDMHTVPSPVRGASGFTKVDASTNFTGPVTVEASDPQAMARELERKARERKLTRPSRAAP